ncbi:MAG: hypothetical protein U0223_06460 [Nitrospira sp.]|nr:hypothetical protein [Nitrospira sp.]
MKTPSCGEMSADLVRDWLDDRLDADRAAEVSHHVGACESCFNAFMKTTAHDLFTFLSDSDTARLSSFMDEVTHLLTEDSTDDAIETSVGSVEDEVPQPEQPSKEVVVPSLPAYLETAASIAAFRRMCHHINESFMQAPGHCLSRNELEQIIRLYLGDPVISVHGRKVHILHILSAERMIELDSVAGVQVEEIYVARWEISPEYLINRVWGVSLGKHMDKLFEGGLRYSGEGGTSMLLEGDAGIGKTMLALHMATAFAKQGFPAVYVSTQGQVGSFLDRLALLGYRHRLGSGSENSWVCSSGQEQFTLRICDRRGEPITDTHDLGVKRDHDGQTLTVYMVDAPWWSTEAQPFLHALKRLHQPERLPSCFVLDCLDDVWGELHSVAATQLSELLTFPPKQIGLLLSSGNWPTERSQQLMRQKMDIILHLTMREREENIKDRTLEITKCRTQGYIRQQHHFSIGRADEGVVIYLSTHARHSIWVKRKPHLGKPIPENFSVDDHFSLNQVVQNDVVRGSSILLRGKRGTHRLPISLAFLASGLRNSKTDHVIFLSLRETEAQLITIIRQYPHFSKYLLDGARFSSRVTFGYRPSGPYGPERILDWMSREVGKAIETSAKRGPSKVTRIVISSLAHLRSSPLFQRDTTFIPALLQLFKKEHVTALYIDEPGEPSDQIGHRFDVILAAEQDDTDRKSDDIRIRVENALLCNANHGWHRIRRESAKGNEAEDLIGRRYVFKNLGQGPASGSPSTSETEVAEHPM